MRRWQGGGEARCPVRRASRAFDVGTQGGSLAQHLTRRSAVGYDALGRADYVQSGYGTSVVATDVTRTFTANGQLQTVTDAENNKTTYTYDGHDRLVNTNFPNPTTHGVSSGTDYDQRGYDANGNVTSFTTRRGETLTMTFDSLNRVTRKTVPERSGLDRAYTRDVFYAYDLFGDLSSACFGNTTSTPETVTSECINSSFDALGRIAGTTNTMDTPSPVRTLGYTYDVAGNRTQMTYPDGNYVTYNRTPAGELYYMSVSGTPAIYPPRDTAGRTSVIYRLNSSTGNWGANTSFTYDGSSRLQTQTFGFISSSYNSTSTFAYNPANQITSRARTNDYFASTTMSSQNNTRDLTSNGLNQYTQWAQIGNPTATYGYDANGNLSTATVPSTTVGFIYDVENRMVGRTQTSGPTATLRYDPLGRLYETGSTTTATTRFLYDGDALIAEYNSAGALLRRYVHGTSAGDDPLVWFDGSGVSNSERRYLYADERGSIAAVTDSVGNVTYSFGYDEYGVPSNTDVVRFGYTGQAYIPEVGMYYYKARMYSPGFGRFMQTDPIGYGDGMNMYRYVGNDPINGADPTGLCGPGDRAPTEEESAACQRQQEEQYKDYHPVDYLAGSMMAGWAMGQMTAFEANRNIDGSYQFKEMFFAKQLRTGIDDIAENPSSFAEFAKLTDAQLRELTAMLRNDSVVDSMVKSVMGTRQTGNEFGFWIYRDGARRVSSSYFPGKIIEGHRRSLDGSTAAWLSPLQIGAIATGHFHTHPGGTMHPSEADVNYYVSSSWNVIGIIAAPQRNGSVKIIWGGGQ